MIFIEASLTPRDAHFAQEAEQYKVGFEALLARATEGGMGIVRPETVQSGEFVTDLTLGCEQKTQNFTGIGINQEITRAQSRLYGLPSANVTPQRAELAAMLNKEAAPLIEGLINFKRRVLEGVTSCQMFMTSYPSMIAHVLHEAEDYRNLLSAIEAGRDIDRVPISRSEDFWSHIMMEHALFVRGMLDPAEKELVSDANTFANEFSELLTSSTKLDRTRNTINETQSLRNFKFSATAGIAECRIRSVIVPLLGDHILREANRYLRLLRMAEA